MLSAPKMPMPRLRDCPGYDYYVPEASASKPLRVLTALEQMYGYYEAA